MNEIQKIYNMWSEYRTENSKIKNAWTQALDYMYEHCSEIARDEIAGYMIEYGRLIEEQAFIAGYKQAFQLWSEIIGNKK